MPATHDRLRLGLRFPRSASRVLRNLGDECARHGTGDPGLFYKAADSAKDGEPLVVQCSEVSEVHEMAALFATLGVGRPAVEDLNG